MLNHLKNDTISQYQRLSASLYIYNDNNTFYLHIMHSKNVTHKQHATIPVGIDCIGRVQFIVYIILLIQGSNLLFYFKKAMGINMNLSEFLRHYTLADVCENVYKKTFWVVIFYGGSIG